MEAVDVCPVCSNGAFTQLHELTLHREHFAEPERRRWKDNSYHRNHILFEHIVDQEALTARFLQCERCGFIFFTPRPTPVDLAVKYDLVADEHDTEERERLRRVVDLREMRGRAIRSLLEGYWRRDSGRALDIGGADGHCLKHLAPDFDCGVLDFEDRTLVAGVRRLGRTIEDLEEHERFDVCITNHTLEHIPDLRQYVGAIRAHLTDQGILYIEVPQGCAGEILVTRNLLTHLNFFSTGSLGYLLEDCGLVVEHIKAGATLSMNRYLPVITAIARASDVDAGSTVYRTAAAEITRREMTNDLRWSVLARNAGLVLRHPVRYARGFARRRALLGADRR